ncbi:MAG: CocE/NonD family hydrolase, partial [Ginsengibacter sp.]
MKKVILSLTTVLYFFSFTNAQNDSSLVYKKSTAMIPMRDGIKLFTVLLTPVHPKDAVPFLIERTPYGADIPIPDDSVINIPHQSSIATLAEEGYIFVFQDIRGKYKSEGTMQIHQPLIHETQKGAIDESTDTYDAIDWLLKN